MPGNSREGIGFFTACSLCWQEGILGRTLRGCFRGSRILAPSLNLNSLLTRQLIATGPKVFSRATSNLRLREAASGPPFYHVPVYRRPSDLVAFSDDEQANTGLAYGRRVSGKALPYYSRKEIEQGLLDGQGLEIVWLRDWVDAFFIHIQGSGRVRLRDGSVLRLSYSAKSGLPYTGIGALLVERGASHAKTCRCRPCANGWRKTPRKHVQLMWENQSFIFFREVELEKAELGALGAQHVQLTPRRSIAVDRALWAFGTPVWLDTTVPEGDGTTHRELPAPAHCAGHRQCHQGAWRAAMSFGDLANRRRSVRAT